VNEKGENAMPESSETTIRRLALEELELIVHKAMEKRDAHLTLGRAPTPFPPADPDDLQSILDAIEDRKNMR